MKKLRVYIDTSVFGGVFDDEFEEHTLPLFEKFSKGDFTILFSTITRKELENAPSKVREFVSLLNSRNIEPINETLEAVSLSTEYLKENVVGKTSYLDCLHIALATINKADLLLSWNFKHIVNIKRIYGYNSVNIKNGYQQLEIRSPREFNDYEN